jgi:hypothetical protein
MPKGTTFDNDLLKLIFQNTAIANIGNAGGLQPSSTAGSLYVALHTADPSAGDQSTNEVAYAGGYARVAVARSAAGFNVASNVVTFVSAVTFAACTGGSVTATHFSIGSLASGAGEILYSGTLTPNIVITNGVTPQIAAASSVTET